MDLSVTESCCSQQSQSCYEWTGSSLFPGRRCCSQVGAGVPGSSCGDRCSRVWGESCSVFLNCLPGLPEALPEALLFFSCSHSCIPLTRQSACDWIALKPSCRLWRPRVNPWKRSWTCYQQQHSPIQVPMVAGLGPLGATQTCNKVRW